MKTLTIDSLPELPKEIKNLVADGVYTLFSINHGSNMYALLIGGNSQMYLLNNTGHVVESNTNPTLDDLGVIEAVTFPRIGNDTIRINAL